MKNLCIYLDEGRGDALMHVHVYINGNMGIHILSLYYRTAWWMFMELGRDEVLMAHTCV